LIQVETTRFPKQTQLTHSRLPIADSRPPCSHVETAPPHLYFVLRHSSCGSRVEVAPHPSYFVPTACAILALVHAKLRRAGVLRTFRRFPLQIRFLQIRHSSFVLRHSRRFIR